MKAVDNPVYWVAFSFKLIHPQRAENNVCRLPTSQEYRNPRPCQMYLCTFFHALSIFYLSHVVD